MVVGWMLKKLLMGNAFAAEQGRIRLFGRMDWVMIPARALAVDIQMIGERNGEEFLYRLGYDGAKEGAREMIRDMGLRPRGGWVTQKSVLKLLEFLGYGKPRFVQAKVRKDGHHHVVFHIGENPVIEQAARMFGVRSMVCYWFMGIYAAHGEMELGLKHVKLRENACLCRGAPRCEWETRW